MNQAKNGGVLATHSGIRWTGRGGIRDQGGGGVMRKTPPGKANKKVKQFFDYLGTTVEINKENLSLNFWSTSSMMAPFYELLQTLSSWLNSKGINKMDAQKYITSLFIALSEDAKVNAKKDLKILVKNSQTPRGLNEQAVNELRKSGFFKSLNITTNSVLKRLKK